MYMCVCAHSDISTTKQVHEKLSAPPTNKAMSGTGVGELMGGVKAKKKMGKQREGARG